TRCLLQWNTTGATVAGDASGATGITLNRLNNPNDISLDSNNTLYIADTGNNRVLQWVIGATSGTVVAGQANTASGATANQLNGPQGVVVDTSSNIYVADTNNNRVQSWPTLAVQGTTISVT
ncbi:unnamed protein product, partial [Rotaria sordida]